MWLASKPSGLSSRFKMCIRDSYKIAQKNKAAVDKGREQVAKAINADTNEIYFTAGGSLSLIHI